MQIEEQVIKIEENQRIISTNVWLYVFESNINIFWKKIFYFIHCAVVAGHIFIKACEEAVTRPTTGLSTSSHS